MVSTSFCHEKAACSSVLFVRKAGYLSSPLQHPLLLKWGILHEWLTNDGNMPGGTLFKGPASKESSNKNIDPLYKWLHNRVGYYGNVCPNYSQGSRRYHDWTWPRIQMCIINCMYTDISPWKVKGVFTLQHVDSIVHPDLGLTLHWLNHFLITITPGRTHFILNIGSSPLPNVILLISYKCIFLHIERVLASRFTYV